MLMVFGIKCMDASDASFVGKLDPRQLKKSNMTGFQIKMQQKFEQ